MNIYNAGIFLLILLCLATGFIGGYCLRKNEYQCTPIRFSIQDNRKIFKFDKLSLQAGVNHYLKFEEKSKNEIELVVLKEIGRSSVMVEPKEVQKN